MNKRVLMLVYSNVPNDPRVMRSAQALRSAGYEVQVVGAALYGGVSGVRIYEGLPLTTLPIVRGGMLRALWAWLRGRVPEGCSSERSSTLAVAFFNLWLLRLWLFRPLDVIHCHEHQGMAAAWLLAMLKRVPWVYDAHEFTPEHRANMGFRANIAIQVERWLLGRATAVITVGERIAAAYQARGARRVVVIGNWKDAAEYVLPDSERAALREQLGLARYRLVVAYFGALMPERDLAPLLEAVAQLPDVGLLIGGRGADAAHVAAMAQAHANIHWFGWVSMADVARYEALSDVIYYSLNPALSNQTAYSLPNKLFVALATGKVLLARRNVGEMADLLDAIGSGMLLEDVTAATVRDALCALRDDPALLARLQAAAAAGGAQYNAQAVNARLIHLYAELLP